VAVEHVATVLVAEDDPDIRELLVIVFEGAGAAVVAVGNGQEALDALERGSVDLVVTDMWMPNMSGVDLCRRLRARPGGRGLPVIMLSAYGRMGGRDEALHEGADEYLPKPIRPSLLVAKADALLGGGRLTVRGV